MFRKLSEGLASASDRIATALGSDEPKIRQLTTMGFDGPTASQALQATNGNVDQAAELLLASASAQGPVTQQSHQQRQHPTAAVIDLTGDDDDDDDEVMRRVLQQSVDDEQNRLQRQLQTAASRRAGEAALARAGARAATVRNGGKRTTTAAKTAPPSNIKPSASSNSSTRVRPALTISATASQRLAAHHPDVKVIPTLQDKSKEEQVLRCADRLKNSPQAVDTLLRALTTIRNSPNDDKYRTIDKSAAGYKRSMENAPGAEDMLLAMSFRRHNNNQKLVLERSMVDPALLYLGISALEQTKETDEYKQLKRRTAFNKEVLQLLDEDASTEGQEELKKRSIYRAKCPSEPPDGRGAVVQVRVGDQTTLRRKFDADDTLAEVLNWLGAHASIIPERITSREWSLMDLNHYPVAPLDPKSAHLTLQYLGCWPSGKLELVPSTEEWRDGAKSARRTSRGLGSAPSDAL